MELDRNILGLILVIAGSSIILLGKYLTKNARKDKKLVNFSLQHQHFLYNLLYWSVIALSICGLSYLYAKTKQDAWLIIPIVVIYPLFRKFLGRNEAFSFLTKINLRVFDEREDLHCLKAERIAGTIAAYSSLILLGIGKLAEPDFSIYRLLIAPFVIYHITFNLASWWYFRTEEKSITEENGE